MAQSYEFYLERAAQSALAADAAALDNVRERELRAEKSWLVLAEQARKGVLARENADAKRLAKQEAEVASSQ